MAVIRQDDLIDSIADSLQYISYYHPADYIKALGAAYEREESPAAKDAIAQILTNSRMCAQGQRPICQDTGIVTCFVRVGMNVQWADATMSVSDMINEACAGLICIRTTSCAHPSCKTPRAAARTPKTTPRP